MWVVKMSNESIQQLCLQVNVEDIVNDLWKENIKSSQDKVPLPDCKWEEAVFVVLLITFFFINIKIQSNIS